jgi:hypothetical protein
MKIELSDAEVQLVIAALDKKIWSLAQSGRSGAYRAQPAFEALRSRIVTEAKAS